MKAFVLAIIVRLLTLEAKAVLKKYKPRLIVVTGSVGKTSTKDAVYAALKNHTFVRKSEKSYNSDIGVPLTVLGVPNGWRNLAQWARNLLDGALMLLITTPYPRWLVLEVGADRPGEIFRALSWLSPDVVITTRFPDVPVHVEFYDSPDAVFEEELYPVRRVKEGGVLVTSLDEKRRSEPPVGVNEITYGFGKSADVRAGKYRVLKKNAMASGIAFDIAYASEEFPVSIHGVIGKGHVSALLAGVAGALAAGVPFASLQSVGDSYETPPGRLKLIFGIKESVLIDDSYNASPAATEEALRALEYVPRKGRRIAVLADMLELGAYSAGEHARIGAYAADKVDVLITVGVRARAIGEAAVQTGLPAEFVHAFERGSDASAALISMITEGDVILIKGSQSMRMERVVKALMKNPEDAKALLPRQDPEWLAR